MAEKREDEPVMTKADEVAMSVHRIRSELDDLQKLMAHISDHDAAELEIVRFDLEQLLFKIRHPILQQEAAE